MNFSRHAASITLGILLLAGGVGMANASLSPNSQEEKPNHNQENLNLKQVNASQKDNQKSVVKTHPTTKAVTSCIFD